HDHAKGDFPEVVLKAGPTALAGLTLLECGVSLDDRAIQTAADVVRKGSVDMTHTYSLALSILFLDRLGEPEDVSLIQSMAIRLLAGQNPKGGWSYSCPAIGREEKRRLTTNLGFRKDKNDLSQRKTNSAKDGRSPNISTKEIQRQVASINPLAGVDIGSDN